MKNLIIFLVIIVATISLVSTMPSSYAETTYNVYVEPLPEFGSFAQSSVPVALDWWEQQRSDVKFNIVSNPESADFMIQWVKDFGTEVIGYAYGNLFIEVGLGDSTIGETWYPYSTNYVTEIVKHEVGHILGYEHTNNPQDIMYPVSAGTEYGLIEVSFDLLSDEAYFLPFQTQKDTTTINYQVNSENADYGFDVYVVPSEADLDKWASYAPFNYYQDRNCFAENVFHISGTCDVEYGSGLLIISNEQEANKRTYFDVKMTEKSIKIDNVLSSTPTSSVPTSSSNVIPTSTSSYSLYVDGQGRFSIEYPSNWFTSYDPEYDLTSFYDNEESWTSLFTVEGFFVSDEYRSTTIEGKFEEMKELEKDWCNTSTYNDHGQICYNFQILNANIKTLDSGHDMFVVSEKYTLQYGPEFPGEFPITALVTEVHDGNNGWMIYTESDDYTYEAHKEQIKHFIQSFSLTVTSDTHLALVESPSSVTPSMPTPPPMPIPTPEIPISLPSQSKIIEGAFLNIEQSEVSISQSDELINLYGNIGREPNKGERVIINIVYPDGTTNGHTLIPTKDGFFEIPERIDRNSPTGIYQYDAMIRDSFIGKTTLIVNEYSYAPQSPTSESVTPLPTITPVIPSMDKFSGKSDYTITTKEIVDESPTTIQKYSSTISGNYFYHDAPCYMAPVYDDYGNVQGSAQACPSFSIKIPDGWNTNDWGVTEDGVHFMDGVEESNIGQWSLWKNHIMVGYLPHVGEQLSDNEERDWQIDTNKQMCDESTVSTHGFTCTNQSVFYKLEPSYTKDGHRIITTVFKETHNYPDIGPKNLIVTDSFIYWNNDVWEIYTESYEEEFDKNKDKIFESIESFRHPAVANAQTIPQVDSTSAEGGGCLIATAAFGSEMAPQVQFLRELRDNTVMSTESGTAFMTGFNQFYYSFSPYVADYERENSVFKEVVKVTLTPLLTSLTLLTYVEIDTEEEMLGYGIGIILLNIGMYFVIPAIVILKIKNKIKNE